MSNYDLTGGWNPYVAHEGNMCPINPKLRIQYQIEHGDLLEAVAKDAPWGFRHGIGPSIIGFRVLNNEQHEPELSQSISAECSIPEPTQLSRREIVWLEVYKTSIGLSFSPHDEAARAVDEFNSFFGRK